MTAEKFAGAPSPAMSVEDAFAIGRLDAHDQAALRARGEVSALELAEAAIIRIERLNPDLNVITYAAFDAARDRAVRAAGEMAGVPWLLKDGLDYPGMPTAAGSRSKAGGTPSKVSFPYTDCFDAQGLTPLGKTNAPEFGLLPTTEPVLHGPARNPWALDRSPGGSSGGAAAAVAAGMVPLAHAADGGGSIRIPASCCGIVGLKPGRGANLRARAPHLIEDLLACDILLSRSVRDAAWAFRTAAAKGRRAAAPNRRERTPRIALCMDNLWGDAPAPEVRDAILRTAKMCETLGYAVEEAPLPVNGPAVLKAFQTIWGYLAREAAGACALQHGNGALEDILEPWTRDLAAWSDGVSILDAERMVLETGRAAADLDIFFNRFDFILSPVLRLPALPIGALAPTRDFSDIMPLMYDYVSYTPLHNLTGHPAISLPVSPGADGVPIGSMFAAARGGEEALLALAGELETASGWLERWPPFSAG